MWKITDTRLDIVGREADGHGCATIRQYDQDDAVLTHLAPISHQARRAALEIVCDHPLLGHRVRLDAMRAYSWWPLAAIPPSYWRRPFEVDWRDVPPNEGLPVVLNTGFSPEGRSKLLEVADCVEEEGEGEREGLLWALTGHLDEHIVERFLRLIAGADAESSQCNGEMTIFVEGIRRWLRLGVVSLATLKTMYQDIRPRSNGISWQLLLTRLAFVNEVGPLLSPDDVT